MILILSTPVIFLVFIFFEVAFENLEKHLYLNEDKEKSKYYFLFELGTNMAFVLSYMNNEFIRLIIEEETLPDYKLFYYCMYPFAYIVYPLVYYLLPLLRIFLVVNNKGKGKKVGIIALFFVF